MTLHKAAIMTGFIALLACASSCGSSTSPSGTFALTINNFDAWCSISVTKPSGTSLPNGASATTNVVSLAANTVVTLHGEPVSAAFTWAASAGHGGWSGSIDSGQNALSKDTQITLSGNKTVTACCPFADGSGCPF